jgi:hypothetical protein
VSVEVARCAPRPAWKQRWQAERGPAKGGPAKGGCSFRTRLIPYLSRMTSKIEGQRSESTTNQIHMSAALSPSAAGHETRPAHALKVETWVRTPLGLQEQSARSGH